MAENQIPKVTVKPISEIKFRDDNPRFHSEQNLELIKNSLQRNKAGRSILIDENDQSLAGEGTTRSAIEAGIKEVLIIETTGDQLVAVKRTDLSEDQKAEMILLDNRTNETSEWDSTQTAEMLHRLNQNGIDPQHLGFSGEDLKYLVEHSKLFHSDLAALFSDADGFVLEEKNVEKISFKFPPKITAKVRQALAKIDKNPEQALLKALGIDWTPPAPKAKMAAKKS